MNFRTFSVVALLGLVCGVLMFAALHVSSFEAHPTRLLRVASPPAAFQPEALSVAVASVPCADASANSTSSRLDEHRQAAALLVAVRQVEARMRSSATYAVQIERALQGIDK